MALSEKKNAGDNFIPDLKILHKTAANKFLYNPTINHEFLLLPKHAVIFFSAFIKETLPPPHLPFFVALKNLQTFSLRMFIS